MRVPAPAWWAGVGSMDLQDSEISRVCGALEISRICRQNPKFRCVLLYTGLRPVLGTFDPHPATPGLDRLRRTSTSVKQYGHESKIEQ